MDQLDLILLLPHNDILLSMMHLIVTGIAASSNTETSPHMTSTAHAGTSKFNILMIHIEG
jgi:hypothetical protein